MQKAVAVVLVILSTSIKALAASCPLQVAAILPVSIIGGSLAVTMRMKGQDLKMLIDTGSSNSFITQATYDRLNLTGGARIDGAYSEGLGGHMQTSSAIMEDVQLGLTDLHGQDFFISNFGPEAKGKQLLDGLLGYDILAEFDVALDLPDGKITLYFQQACAAGVTPWAGDFDVEPFVPRHDNIDSPDISIAIDDKPMTIVIDSGAASSLVLQAALKRMQVKPEAAPNVSFNESGFGDLNFAVHHEQFSSFNVGAESFSDAWLYVESTAPGDVSYDSDGFVGDDYLAHHRVFLANDTRTAYLSTTVTGVK